MIELYQMPISHYCEKARWALSHKKLDFRVRNLLPGLHVKKARALSGQTGLPIIKDGSRAVHGSAAITSYLDKHYPSFPLTPADAELADQALEWERFVDDELGEHVRRVVYHYLLDHPDIVIPMFASGGAWYSKLLLRRIFPKLSRRMRRYMSIDENTSRHSLELVEAGIAKLNARLADRPYLVAGQFTRADLSAAALLAPFHAPEKYPIPWPAQLPDGLREISQKIVQQTPWVGVLYAQHR